MGTAIPDVDALVAELRTRVEERRRQGAYPPGLEDELSDQARLLLARRVHTRRAIDVSRPLAAVEAALPLGPDRIPDGSRGGLGAAVDRAVARVVEHQFEAVLAQVQAFADPVSEALAALAVTVERLRDEVDGLHPPVRAVIERQALEERIATQAAARPAG